MSAGVVPPCAATAPVGKLVGAGGFGTLHVPCTLNALMWYMTIVYMYSMIENAPV